MAVIFYVIVVMVSCMSSLLKAGTAAESVCVALLDETRCNSERLISDLSRSQRNLGFHEEPATAVKKRNSKPGNGTAHQHKRDYENRTVHASRNSRFMAPLTSAKPTMPNSTHDETGKAVVASAIKRGLDQRADNQQKMSSNSLKKHAPRQANLVGKPKIKTKSVSKKTNPQSKSNNKKSFIQSRKSYRNEKKKPSKIEVHKEKLKREIIEKLQENSERLFEHFELFSNTTDEMRKQLLCELKKARPTVLTSSEFPFNRNKRLGRHFPKTSVPQLPIRKHCALVASAGSILGSKLGSEIDAADHVVRFNHAPVLPKWAKDIGNRTTMRLVNDFVTDDVPTINRLILQSTLANAKSIGKTVRSIVAQKFDGATIFAWDFCDASSRMSSHKCYMNVASGRPTRAPGFGRTNALGGYLDWAEKYGNGRKIYHLKQQWLYSLVDIMQRVSPYFLDRMLFPSTGFLGLAFMLHKCEWLHLYHFVPTFKPRWAPCKYYLEGQPANTTVNCSLTPNVHQRLLEPALYMMLNEAPDSEVFGPRGHVLIRGVVNLKCP